MSLTDAPDAQARLSRLHRHAPPSTTFRSARSISAPATPASASGATSSPGIATSFPIRARWSRKFERAGHAARSPTSSRACSTITPRTPKSRRAAHSSATREPASPASVSSGTARARTSTSRIPPASRWWQRRSRAPAARLRHRSAGTTTTNTRSGTRTAASHGFGHADPDRALAAAAGAADDARDLRSAGGALARTSACTRSRAPGRPGIQRYAQTWSGDNTTSWHTLRWNIRMGLTMSLSGMFNTGHDVGGFHGPVPDPELLVRWVQSGAFSPRFIMNSWKAGGEVNTPWLHPSVTADHPRLDSPALSAAAVPLHAVLARRAVRRADAAAALLRVRGRSARRSRTATISCSGPNLLVASVVEPGQRERSVYLPKGPASGSTSGPGSALPRAATRGRRRAARAHSAVRARRRDDPDDRHARHAPPARRAVARAAPLSRPRARQERASRSTKTMGTRAPTARAIGRKSTSR